MAVTYEYPRRSSAISAALPPPVCLTDKFEILKDDIGDGSFGCVALGRVRTAGQHIARRGTLVAIKTMKKTFDSFAACLELREVIFLRSLPVHAHLVPALDISLDPYSKKLHICMEHMDGNLYQLMKARDHKHLDGASVKSILFQILSGLEHIHAHGFFHRDIKPENILVSTSAPQDSGTTTFHRHSAIATPPSTPPLYTIKIADFGLARETLSKSPYTTYVSTRWYRAPEVLLRAGEYSAPVDIWAIGAMAVEVATLKPLFPGSNEVDQVWRVCEIMGSPGNWYSKGGSKVGGGDWREGTRLAQKLGFSFPKMAPHAMDSILQTPRWPESLSNFVTACLMWDPRNRPTAKEALAHTYFRDAVDPLRPVSRHLSRKQSDITPRPVSQAIEAPPALTSKPSWFRKSLMGRDSSQNIVSQAAEAAPISPRPTPVQPLVSTETPKPKPQKSRIFADKRATWTNGMPASSTAPMPILPSIRPVSPISDAITVQGGARRSKENLLNESEGDKRRRSMMDEKVAKKIGRQLSVASNGNHYTEMHRQEAERALNGNGSSVMSPNGQKESFFSHLRKRARRFSGRNQLPMSPTSDDVEANAGCGPWSSNRSSVAFDTTPAAIVAGSSAEVRELDKSLQSTRGSIDPAGAPVNTIGAASKSRGAVGASTLKRQHSIRQDQPQHADPLNPGNAAGPISSRTRRAKQVGHPVHRYETPDEEEELLDEMINSAHLAMNRLRDPSLETGNSIRTVKATESYGTPIHSTSATQLSSYNPYPTPSPSAKRNSVVFGNKDHVTKTPALDLYKSSGHDVTESHCPTPPYEDNEWAAAAAASIYAAGESYR
ncbi:MAG: hypothetical protein M1825_000697 [Sarcosagium campestre]|nr:MAG: hypothetical protein M1825_000697 [Sarcosagium campestre]